MKPQIPTTELTITRTIRASAEDIYDVWIDPKSPGGPWYGTPRVILDAKVDGLFYQGFEMDGRTSAHYGRFITLDRGRTIAHTWVSESTRGLESIVTITLESQGDATLLTLRHTNVPDDEAGRQHREGWDWVVGCLAEACEARARSNA